MTSATLPLAQQLEQNLLSRNPSLIGQTSSSYAALYGALPTPTDASPQQRDLVDMTDAAAQTAMKRAIEIDALANLELQAAAQINQSIQVAAPGSAPIMTGIRKLASKLKVWIWGHKVRTAVLVIVSILAMPRPMGGQLPSPCCAILAAGLSSISSALSSVIGGGLNSILGIDQQIQKFQQQIVWPQNLISQARALVGNLQGIPGSAPFVTGPILQGQGSDLANEGSNIAVSSRGSELSPSTLKMKPTHRDLPNNFSSGAQLISTAWWMFFTAAPVLSRPESSSADTSG